MLNLVLAFVLDLQDCGLILAASNDEELKKNATIKW